MSRLCYEVLGMRLSLAIVLAFGLVGARVALPEQAVAQAASHEPPPDIRPLTREETQIFGELAYAAITAERAGRFAESARFWREARTLNEQTYGPDHPSTAGLLQNQAQNLLRAGYLNEARAGYSRALQILIERYGEGDERVRNARDLVARTYLTSPN